MSNRGQSGRPSTTGAGFFATENNYRQERIRQQQYYDYRERLRARLREEVHVEVNYAERYLKATLRGYFRFLSFYDFLRESYIDLLRSHLANEIVTYYMEHAMPNQAALTTDDTAEFISLTSVNSAREQLQFMPSPPPYYYRIQQDTNNADLAALRDQYPEAVRERDFQQPLHAALRAVRCDIKASISYVRKLQIAQSLWRISPTKARKHFKDLMLGLTVSDMHTAFSDNDVNRLTGFRNCYALIERYREEKAQFIDERERYAPLQAQYHQRAAMIRQRPMKPVEIDVTQLVDNVKTWDHVFAISAHIDTEEDKLFVRVGLCDIVMSESAAETVYNDPQDIQLAPFYFTFWYDRHGRFSCMSRNNNTLGASYELSAGMSWDVHPHQLNDSPCFGTFGQSLNDMAGAGDLQGLISGIIAFYSQYNTQDSAGVKAKNWHPRNLGSISDSQYYVDRMLQEIECWGTVNYFDLDKLNEAMARYGDYCENCTDPPHRAVQHYCESCEEADCSDHRNFYYDVDGGRICPDCWTDHYCGECERHVEDCVCESDDDY